MQRSDCLVACAPGVYLFDWFKCIASGYAASSDPPRLQPPSHHFLRHGSYFSASAAATGSSKKRAKKRARADAVEVNPLMTACAQSVLRAVADETNRPSVSWLAASPPAHGAAADWPDIAGQFDSAALLTSGSLQPFLRAKMDNASRQCSVLEIGDARVAVAAGAAAVQRVTTCFCGAGGDEFVIPPGSAFLYAPAIPARDSRACVTPAMFCRLDDIASLDAAAATTDRPPAALLIVDPPWDNRSAQRSRAYATMTLRSISQIRLGDWCLPPPSA
jgi:hypothetical protein